MFGEGASSDQPHAVLLAELIREAVDQAHLPGAAPRGRGDRRGDRMSPRDGLARVRALIWVESESQKGILVGARGRMIKAIGVAARRELERELGCSGAPRPVGARPSRLARGRRAARPPGHHLSHGDRVALMVVPLVLLSGCQLQSCFDRCAASRSTAERSSSATNRKGSGWTSKLPAAQAGELVVLEAGAVVHGARGQRGGARHGVAAVAGVASPFAGCSICGRAPRRRSAAAGCR